MRKVKTHEAKTQFSQLISQVLCGERVAIYRGSRPVARLVPYAEGEDSEPELERARVGTVTSAPVEYDEDAFAPFGDDELGEWGL